MALPEKTILIYGTPANGHMNPLLFFAHLLAEKKYHVIFYTTDQYQKRVEQAGCEYRRYAVDTDRVDLTDGKKLLRFYRLLLEYAWKMTAGLVEEARKESPFCIFHDSVALWGRITAFVLQKPSVSCYSLFAIDRPFSPSFFAYAAGFSLTFFRYCGELPHILYYRKKLRDAFAVKKVGFLDCIMNKGTMNLMSYARRMQPGGEQFDQSYFFFGPAAGYRGAEPKGHFALPGTKIVYISFGTIFDADERFYREMISQLGNTEYTVIWSLGKKPLPAFLQGQKLPENLIVKEYVNQMEVLRRAAIFITAGGTNSIQEAMQCRVPCLVYPRQGEQRLNARQLQKLGFGIILKNPKDLSRKIRDLEKIRMTWDEKTAQELTAIHLDAFWQRFRALTGEQN